MPSVSDQQDLKWLIAYWLNLLWSVAFISLLQKSPQTREMKTTPSDCALTRAFVSAQRSLTASLRVFVRPRLPFVLNFKCCDFYLLWCQLLNFPLPSLLISFSNMSVCCCWSLIFLMSCWPSLTTSVLSLNQPPFKGRSWIWDRKTAPPHTHLFPLSPFILNHFFMLAFSLPFYLIHKTSEWRACPQPFLVLGFMGKVFHSNILPPTYLAILTCSPWHLDESHFLQWKWRLLSCREDLKENNQNQPNF